MFTSLFLSVFAIALARLGYNAKLTRQNSNATKSAFIILESIGSYDNTY
jgi:hypothetical protein